MLNHLEGDALAKNLQVLTATIDKLKRTELALQAEVQEIKRDTRTARARYQATVLKSSEEVQRKARASSGPRSQPRSPWP